MARPPKNAEGPSATERMEMAFWDSLKDMPFSEITVRDIVERAGVNRNSYYYHYDSMWDLAQASVRNATLPEFAGLLLGDEPSPLLDGDKLDACFERLHVLFGPNGNQRLVDDAKRIIVGEWLAMHKVESDEVDGATYADIDFVFGGMAELLASDNFTNLDDLSVSIEESPLLSQSVATIREELGGGASTSQPGETTTIEQRTTRVVEYEEITAVTSVRGGVANEQAAAHHAGADVEEFDASLKAEELVAAELKAFERRHDASDDDAESSHSIDTENISIFNPHIPVPSTPSEAAVEEVFASARQRAEIESARDEAAEPDATQDEEIASATEKLSQEPVISGQTESEAVSDEPEHTEPEDVIETVSEENSTSFAEVEEKSWSEAAHEDSPEAQPEIVERVVASVDEQGPDEMASFETAAVVTEQPEDDEGSSDEDEPQLSFDIFF